MIVLLRKCPEILTAYPRPILYQNSNFCTFLPKSSKSLRKCYVNKLPIITTLILCENMLTSALATSLLSRIFGVQCGDVPALLIIAEVAFSTECELGLSINVGPPRSIIRGPGLSINVGLPRSII